ncbi:hypothetical protein BSKO_08918 [Bryopsis sp. KO-2023]|nr:hypothetical protein BSKO_08918 [Bryopsis sp. KO-2023]
MERRQEFQDYNGQQGGYQQQPNPMQQYQPQQQLQPSSQVGGAMMDMQNLQIGHGQSPQHLSPPFPGGDRGMAYPPQNMPTQGQGPNMQPGQQPQQNFGQPHGMSGGPGIPISGAPSMPNQGFPQYHMNHGPGMQRGYPTEMGGQSLSPPPPQTQGTGLGIVPLMPPPVSMPQGQQPTHSPWQQGNPNTQTVPPQGIVHSPATLHPQYQPDVPPETPPSLCGVDPPESTRDGGVPRSQGHPGFHNPGPQGLMYNGSMSTRPPPMNQPGTPPPHPSPTPPQSASQPPIQPHQPQMAHQASNPSGQVFQNQNPSGENGPYGPPQVAPTIQNSAFGGRPRAGEPTQQGGYNHWGPESPGQNFSQQGQGNDRGSHQGVDGDAGYGSSQGFHGQTAGHGQSSHMQSQNQPPVMYGQGGVNQPGVENPAVRIDRVPSDRREENGPNGEDEEEDLDVVASRITKQLMGMSKPNQEAFLNKVFEKIGHENVLDAMIDAFGMERVKMAASALS